MTNNFIKLKYKVKLTTSLPEFDDEEILSQKFAIISPISKVKTEWKLSLVMNGWKKFKISQNLTLSSNYIYYSSLFINLEGGKSEVFIGLKRLSEDIDFNISVIVALEKFNEIPGKEIEPKQFFIEINEWSNSIHLVGYAGFVTHNQLNEFKDVYYPDNVLNFKVKILAHSQTIENSSNSASQIGEVIEKLYETMEQADVIIKTADENLKAHSCILSIRSEIFKREFDHFKVYNAEEFTSAIMKKILKFFYTNKLDDIEKNDISQLLQAAKKCGIDKDLIKAYLKYFYTDLENRNPIDIAILIAECESVSKEFLVSSAIIILE